MNIAGRSPRLRLSDPRRANRNAFEPRNRHCRRTHRARLQRHPQSALVEPRSAERSPRRRGSPPSPHARSGSADPLIALRVSATISSPRVTTAPTGTSPAAAASAASSSARRIGRGKGKLIVARLARRPGPSHILLRVVGDRRRLILAGAGPEAAGPAHCSAWCRP